MKIATITQDNLIFEDRIIINNITELIQYFEEFIDPRIERVMNYTIERKDEDINLKESNPEKRLSDLCISLQKQTGKGAIYNVADIQSKVKMAMIKYINLGFTLMVNTAGGWNIISENAIIQYTNDLKYTESDIKILKYANGVHWYAKIRNLDVVIDGEQKWNAKWVAQQKAKEYLNTLII